MSKFLTGIWNHKKKVIFFTGITAWGANYGLEKKRINDEMRVLCLQAKAFGDRPVKFGEKLRKAVVILNHGARKSKARKMYENYAAPLLNLAGIQTTIYTTSDLTKLRDYLDNIEPTNAVIFAGGDSTIFECIQSYLTLDKPELLQTPIGILPLGFSNVVYNSLRPDVSKDAIKIAQAAMNIVNGYFTSTDVLEIKIGDTADKKFAITGVHYGPLKDAENLVPKYWYLGPFDTWFAYFRSMLKGKLDELYIALQYVNPCTGCLRCEQVFALPEIRDPIAHTSQSNSRTWWQGVIPRKKIVLPEQVPEPLPQRNLSVNEDCGVMHDIDITTKDLHLLTKNILSEEEKTDIRSFWLTHRIEGAHRNTDQVRQRHRQVHHSKKYSDIKGYGKLVVSEVKITPAENDLVLFPTIEIDGHNLDITGPVHIKMNQTKLFLFSRQPSVDYSSPA